MPRGGGMVVGGVVRLTKPDSLHAKRSSVTFQPIPRLLTQYLCTVSRTLYPFSKTGHFRVQSSRKGTGLARLTIPSPYLSPARHRQVQASATSS